MTGPHRAAVGWPAGLRGDLGLILAAWFATLGFDFLLHGGLLAHLYRGGGSFLLPAAEAFRRIPLGYASFLVLAGLAWWLCRVLDLSGWRRGFAAGSFLGAAIWGALALGLFSISTASPALLAGWWVGQSVELGIAGAVVAEGLARRDRRGVYRWVLGIVLACIALTVVLQSTGLAPPMERAG